jgi:hypothetical protein
MKISTIAVLGVSAAVASPCFAGSAAGAGDSAGQVQSFLDPAGVFQTQDGMDGFDRRSFFFQSLGTNGRSCGTCHLPSQAFTLSAAAAGLTSFLTQGRDPLFAPVDGANCPNAQPGDPSAHSLLLKNGLFRISLPLPAMPNSRSVSFKILTGARSHSIRRPGRPISPSIGGRYLPPIFPSSAT